MKARPCSATMRVLRSMRENTMHLRKTHLLFLLLVALVAICAIGGGWYWDCTIPLDAAL